MPPPVVTQGFFCENRAPTRILWGSPQVGARFAIHSQPQSCPHKGFSAKIVPPPVSTGVTTGGGTSQVGARSYLGLESSDLEFSNLDFSELEFSALTIS